MQYRLHCTWMPSECICSVQVDIGRGLMVKKGAWEHVQSHHKDSLFVKDLLVTIWSKDNLKERSLHGWL